MIADYRCNACLHNFRKEVKKNKPRCPNCRSTKTVKLILSAPKVIFRGSGFYVNDSKGK